jgi:hypothetical protein
MAASRCVTRTLDQLTVEDERSFRHVGLYGDLARIVAQAGYRFRVLPKGRGARVQRALLLNLTFWDGQGGDVLVSDRVAADVVTHVAWHHLGAEALGAAAATSIGLSLNEAIASAFDAYLVGRLLGVAPRSSFLETQVPAMAEAAFDAGLSATRFDALLRRIAKSPEQAFEDLRALLFDATVALLDCHGVDDATARLARFDAHPYAALLHHYELSNWVLFARAYGKKGSAKKVLALDARLRAAKVSLDVLAREWLAPRL